MFDVAEFEYVARMILAAICGIVIGYERKNRAKEAGVRTHCVVACASALMMVLSKYAYCDVMSMYGDLMKVDPSRIASGVVSGIGFLGAGMIFVEKKTIKGLTTAAGIWATSGIGMAIGAGLYVTGICATAIILMVQVILHMNRTSQHNADRQPILHSEHQVVSVLKEHGIEILDHEESGEDADGKMVYTMTVSIPEKE